MIAALFLAMLPLAAQTTPPAKIPPLSPDIAAQFGTNQITTAEVREMLADLDAKQREALAKDPALLKKTVSTLILQRVVLKQALAKGWDKQPAVEAELKRVRENAIVQSYLQAAAKPPLDFPTTADIQAVYDANKTNLVTPRQYRLAQIFIALPPKADAVVVSLAQSRFDTVKKSLQQPKTDFAAIARTVSDDKSSASKGGDLGWVTERQIQPEIRTQVLALTKGAISPPIKLNDGWHFIQVVDIKEPGTPTLDQVKPELVAQIRAQKTQVNSQAYLAKLLEQNPVTLNPTAIENLLKKDK